jgi:hypothetical protein
MSLLIKAVVAYQLSISTVENAMPRRAIESSISARVVEFCLAVAVGVENAVVNHPKAVTSGVIINAGDNAFAFDDAARVARILPPHAFNVTRMRFVGNCIMLSF